MNTTIETEAYTITVRFAKNNWDREAQRKTRLYVSGETKVDFTEAYELQKANGYAPIGTNPDEDKLFRKLNREVVKNKRAVAADAIEAVYELGEMIDSSKLSFSNKAGCSMCPCSPGFIVDRIVRDIETGRVVTDIWVTVK